MTSLSDKLKVDRDFDIYYFTDADVRAAVKELKEKIKKHNFGREAYCQEIPEDCNKIIDEIFGSRLTQ